MGSKNQRICVVCETAIASTSRSDATHCSARHQKLDYERRKRANYPNPTVEDYQFLQKKLESLQLAADFVGYALRYLVQNGRHLDFPLPGKKTKRFDGAFRERPYYWIYPFEPPRLPAPGLYTLFLVKANGQMVIDPRLATPVEVQKFFLTRETKPLVRQMLVLPTWHWQCFLEKFGGELRLLMRRLNIPDPEIEQILRPK